MRTLKHYFRKYEIEEDGVCILRFKNDSEYPQGVEYDDVIDCRVDELEKATCDYLDSVAKERGYYDIMSLCSYNNSNNLIFATEGRAGVRFRDDVWVCFYDLTTKMQSGDIDFIEPSNLGVLPKIEW